MIIAYIHKIQNVLHIKAKMNKTIFCQIKKLKIILNGFVDK